MPDKRRGADEVRVIELGTIARLSGYELRCDPAGVAAANPHAAQDDDAVGPTR